MFCVLDGFELEVPTGDAVDLMLGVAAGELDEADVAEWLIQRIRTRENA